MNVRLTEVEIDDLRTENMDDLHPELFAAVERLVDARLAQHRKEWASYFESWWSAVGPEPLTIENVIRSLRYPVQPFGIAAGTSPRKRA